MAISDYAVEMFVNNFKKMRSKRIVLYGLGGNTQKILEKTSAEYNIVALMDAEKVGQRYWNLPVISVKEAKSNADIVIVVARDSVLRIIYQRISELEDFDIPIYDVKGNRLKEIFSNENFYTNQPYWKKNLQELKEKIDQYEIISFDIYDTLIMRCVPRDTIIFELVEEELKQTYKIDFPFAFCRVRAEEKENRKNAEVPNIYQIYDTLQESFGVSDAKRNLLLKLELDMEEKYSCKRNDMAECVNYAISKGKKVYLISDMYLPSKHLKRILSIHGITQYDALFVSCERGKTKASGELFFEIAASERKQMLHIGDNEKADFINAKKAGCSAYLVWSAYQMLVNSNLNGMLVHIKSLADNLLVGNFMSSVLNSPFALNLGKGKLVINSKEDFCNICFVPYFLRLLQWFLQFSEWQEGGRSIFLLASRDGYLIKRILDGITRDDNIKKMLPDYVYFYTSRRASTVATIYNEADIEFLLENFQMTANFGYILKTRFGILPDDNDIHAQERISVKAELKKLKVYMKPYNKKILKEAQYERDNYLKYIANNFDLNSYDNFFVYDLACHGTVAYNLIRLLQKDLKQVCFATFNIPNCYFQNLNNVFSLLGNYDDYHLPFKLLYNYKLFEIISASQETSLIKFDEEGNPEFDHDVQYQNAGEIGHMQDVIVDVIDNWHMVDVHWEKRAYSVEICDFMFSIMEEKYAIVSEKIKNAFVYESKEDNETEHNIWQEIVG